MAVYDDEKVANPNSPQTSAEYLERAPTLSPEEAARRKANLRPQELANRENSGSGSNPTTPNSHVKEAARAGVQPTWKQTNLKGSETSLSSASAGMAAGAVGLATGPAGMLKTFTGKLNRKNTTIGVVAGVVVVGGIVGFSIVQGPLKLIHLSENLTKPNLSRQQKVYSLRLNAYARYVRTGDIGETRVSNRASKAFARVTEDLRKSGIEFSNRNPDTGTPRTMRINTTSQNSPFKNFSGDRQRVEIAKALNIPESSLVVDGPDSFRIDLDSQSAKGITAINRTVRSSLSLLGDGSFTAAINMRNFKRFYGLPDLFSPLETRIRAAEERATTARQTKAERKRAEAERTQKIRSPVIERAATARASLKSKLDGKEALIGGISTGIVTGAFGAEILCLVRDTADNAVVANYNEIVAATIIESTDKVAAGAQVQSGNVSLSAIGDVVASLEDDDGRDVTAGKALNATFNGTGGTGEDLPFEYAQAYSSDTTANKIYEETDFNVGAGPIDLDVTDVLCSPAGRAITGLVGVATSVIAVVLAPPTGGTSLSYFAAKQGAQAAASSGALYFLQKQFAKLISNEAVLPANLSGPLGGNLLAYGMRASSNLNAISAGGVALAGSNVSSFDSEYYEERDREFRSKSFFARTFDPYNYSSLTGQIVNKTPNKPVSNIASITTGLVSGSAFTSIFNNIALPRVNAQENSTYEWNFPRYGIPESIINDPQYADPWENNIKVQKILDEGKHIEKAEVCFGNEITKTPEGWDALAVKDVNPNSGEYIDADCDNLSDPDWVRVILFVHDSKLIASAACSLEDDTACSDLSAGPAITASNLEDQITAGEPPDEINGRKLNNEEKENLKYIKSNVMPLLEGSRESQAQIAAESAWWSMRESVLKIKQPDVFKYSNCNFGPNDDRYIEPLDTCPGAKPIWQVGISGVQVNNFEDSFIEKTAKERHPDKSTAEILTDLANLGEFSNKDAVVNSSGALRRSLLVRDPAIGMTLVNINIRDECLGSRLEYWCTSVFDGNDPITSNRQNITTTIEALKQYFLDTGSGGSESGPLVNGTAQELAREILNNGNFDLTNYCRYCVEDLRNTAEGRPAYGDVEIDVRILQFLAELGKEHKVDVNSISGAGSGHSDGSRHYTGKAIDFECSGTPSGGILDSIAEKYGVASNFERCDRGVNHWHYSVGGS